MFSVIPHCNFSLRFWIKTKSSHKRKFFHLKQNEPLQLVLQIHQHRLTILISLVKKKKKKTSAAVVLSQLEIRSSQTRNCYKGDFPISCPTH